MAKFQRLPNSDIDDHSEHDRVASSDEITREHATSSGEMDLLREARAASQTPQDFLYHSLPEVRDKTGSHNHDTFNTETTTTTTTTQEHTNEHESTVEDDDETEFEDEQYLYVFFAFKCFEYCTISCAECKNIHMHEKKKKKKQRRHH